MSEGGVNQIAGVGLWCLWNSNPLLDLWLPAEACWFVGLTAGFHTYRLLTPIIGEPVQLDNANQRFLRWWKDVE